MSTLTGVGILETGRGIFVLAPDWSDGCSPGVVVVVEVEEVGGVEIVVERLFEFACLVDRKYM